MYFPVLQTWAVKERVPVQCQIQTWVFTPSKIFPAVALLILIMRRYEESLENLTEISNLYLLNIKYMPIFSQDETFHKKGKKQKHVFNLKLNT